MNATKRARKPARDRKPAWLESLAWASNAEWFRGSWLVQAEWLDADHLQVRIYRCGAEFATETWSLSVRGAGSSDEAFARLVVAHALQDAEKRLGWVLASVRPLRASPATKPERARSKAS